MRINLPILSQRDPRWKDFRLGTSTVSIGNYGCLISCMSMIARYYGKDTDPERLNYALKANGGYASGNLYKWYDGVPKIYADIVCTKIVSTSAGPVTAAQFAEMEAEINAGRPVVLEVDFTPAEAKYDMHFVVLIGKEGDNWIVADPWYGDVANLTRYGKPALTIQRYVTHTGPMQAPVPQATEDLQKIIDELRTQRDTNHRLHMDETERNKQLTERIVELEGTVSQKNEEIKKLQMENITLQDRIFNMAKAIEADAIEDRDTGRELVSVSSERDDLLKDIATIGDRLNTLPNVTDILAAIEDLSTPIEDAMEPVLKQNEELAKVLFDDFVYKRAPKVKSFFGELYKKVTSIFR